MNATFSKENTCLFFHGQMPFTVFANTDVYKFHVKNCLINIPLNEKFKNNKMK